MLADSESNVGFYFPDESSREAIYGLIEQHVGLVGLNLGLQNLV